MKSARYLHFSSFCLDRIEEQLWQETNILLLRRKPLAVLRYLLEHAGEVVTKDAVLTALWPNVHVSEEVLTVHLREVRQVLGDDAHAPRFIETVHGRGYRFIAPVAAGVAPVPSSKFQVPSPEQSRVQSVASRVRRHNSKPTPHTLRPTPSLVGREAELAQLHHWLDKALSGERQVVFVTGEPGIGKTTVVEAFLSGIGQQATGNGEQTRQKQRAKRG